MALTTKKSTTLTGQSMIGDRQAVYYRAEISEENGTSTLNQAITDQALYEANRVECRNDFRAFQDAVWEIEDQLEVGVE